MVGKGLHFVQGTRDELHGGDGRSFVSDKPNCHAEGCRRQYLLCNGQRMGTHPNSAYFDALDNFNVAEELLKLDFVAPRPVIDVDAGRITLRKASGSVDNPVFVSDR